MRVLLTGATGFVGGHVTADLTGHGHEVVALVRDRRRLEATTAALGVEVAHVVVGDMTEPTTVDAALDGVDAVVHCAAVVSLDRRRDAEMRRTNRLAFGLVVGGAVDRELDPIVHLSSTSALFRPGTSRLTADHPVSDVASGYGRSKAECERDARMLQARAAPVTIVYPSGIVGPAAGGALGETATEMAAFVAGGIMPTRAAALSLIDVRDLSEAIRRLVEPGCGPRRVMAGGHTMTMHELAELLRAATGRRFPVPPVPPSVLRGAGRAMDAARRLVPVESSFSAEAMEMVTRWPGTDDRELRSLGIELRDPVETMTASIRAWYDAGLLTSRQAGTSVTTDPAKTGPARPGTIERMKGVKVSGRVLASRPFRWAAPKLVPPMHRAVYRLSRGRTLFDSAAQPMLMLTTIGARSGQPRQTPLACVPLDQSRVLVVGSNFAQEKHPAWTGNLLADPTATVSFRGETYPVNARLLVGDERAERWSQLLGWYPGWDHYTKITDREFRVFELTRQSPGEPGL